jgi:nucleoside-diphosphate-sugar epimerase
MKILVTGGLGYIGSKLVLSLKENGYDVEVFDKPKDILNIDELREAISKVDIVYHLAALAELKYTDAHPDETYAVNIEGANNVAKVCAENGVVLDFVSTCCIYGNPLEIPSREGGLINPSDTYAMSKASGEYLVKMWGLAKGLKYNILRFGTVYGQSLKKEMRGDMCIQKFIDAAIKKEMLTITGDGGQNRNFIHIDDLVKGLVKVVDVGIIGETINLAGNEKISINDIARFALDHGAIGKSYVPERKDDFYDQNVSLEKAKELLGWEPEIKFENGIKLMYEWVCSH